VTSPSGSLMEFDWNGDGIYGDNSGMLSNGRKTLKARNLKAETVTIVAAAETVTTPTPPSDTIAPTAFDKLQILVPGEAVAPGTVSGITGTPSPQTLGIAFNVTVNAVDEFWNLVSSVTDTVAITVQGFTWKGDGSVNLWTTIPSVVNWTDPLGTTVAFSNGNLAVFNDTSTNLAVGIVDCGLKEFLFAI
jgi:hypothetical protein